MKPKQNTRLCKCTDILRKKMFGIWNFNDADNPRTIFDTTSSVIFKWLLVTEIKPASPKKYSIHSYEVG